MSKIELTAKEQAIVWALVCWFDKPFTGVLKGKLYAGSNQTIAKKYDKQIEDRIIKLGKWLESRRDETE